MVCNRSSVQFRKTKTFHTLSSHVLVTPADLQNFLEQSDELSDYDPFVKSQDEDINKDNFNETFELNFVDT